MPLRREVFHLEPPHIILPQFFLKKKHGKYLHRNGFLLQDPRRERACPPRREVFHLEPHTSVMRLARPHKLDVFNVIYVKQARYNRTTLSSTYFKYSRYPQIVRNR